MVCYLQHVINHSFVDEVVERWLEAEKQSLYYVGAIGVHAELYDMKTDCPCQYILLIWRGQETNECLERMGATLVASGCSNFWRKPFEQSLPLLYRTCLEGLAAQVVAIGIAHELHNILLDLFKYQVNNT